MKPEDVNHKKFETKEILYNGNGFSVAYGIWEGGSHVIAMRWNGESEKDKWYPNHAGNPVWFIIPNDLMVPILKSLLEKEESNKEQILDILEPFAKLRVVCKFIF